MSDPMGVKSISMSSRKSWKDPHDCWKLKNERD